MPNIYLSKTRHRWQNIPKYLVCEQSSFRCSVVMPPIDVYFTLTGFIENSAYFKADNKL